MKHRKISGAVAMAIASGVLALAASASATTVTGPSGETTPTIHMVNENGHLSIHNSIWNIECSSTIEGTVSSHGTGVTAKGNISTLLFNNCTNEWVFDVVANGSFEIHYKEAGSGHGVGTVTWTGTKITTTRAGLSCVYETNTTPIGTLTGGTPATLSIEANLPRVGGSFLCGGSTVAWTGSYVTTKTLAIDP
jgi:hypothetical protein